MKLLVVSPYPPTPPLAGGRRRIFEQLRTWAGLHDIDLACLTYADEDERKLQQLLPSIRRFTVRHDSAARPADARPRLVRTFWNERFAHTVASLATNNRYDWIVAEHSYVAPYVECLPSRKLLTEHNVEYRLLEQIAACGDTLDLARHLTGSAADAFDDATIEKSVLEPFERELWRAFDATVVVSNSERAIVTAATGRPVLLAENCPSGVSRHHLPAGPPTVVFVGSLNYLPNVDAIVQMAEHIVPAIRRERPGVEVIVAGREPHDLLVDYCCRKGLRLVENPEHIDVLVTDGSVMVVPLRLGAGTRIKILDAMALGVPVVASSTAVEGLELGPSDTFPCADDPNDMAELAVHLLDSVAERDRLRRAGHENLRSRRTWHEVFDHLGAALVTLYDTELA